jgi:hypothetical protein
MDGVKKQPRVVVAAEGEYAGSKDGEKGGVKACVIPVLIPHPHPGPWLYRYQCLVGASRFRASSVCDLLPQIPQAHGGVGV